ncbi:MAG: OFA family MFS transporter [Vulcanimicrobiaceae bacterium]
MLVKRWIVASAGLACVLGPGALYSFSLYSAALAAAFGWSPSALTWAFALANVFFALGCACGGWLSDRFGPRYVATGGIALWAGGFALCATLAQSHTIFALYVYYSAIAGTGCGVAYISALNAVIRWFPASRGFGGGLVMMGFGLGSFAYNTIVKTTAAYATVSTATQTYVSARTAAAARHQPFEAARYLLEPAALATLMSIFAASALVFAIVGIAAALVLDAPRGALAEPVATKRQFTSREMLWDSRYYVLWAILFLNLFGGVTVISNMVPFIGEITDLSAASAATLYAFLAIFNGVGRLFWGWLSDRIGRRVVFALLFGSQSLAFFALDSTHDTVLVSIAIGVLLLCYGGGFGVMPAFNADYFGTKHFGSNYGLQLSAFGVATVVGTYLLSLMKGISGSYIGLVQPVSIALLVAMFFPLIVDARKRDAKPETATLASA